MPKNLGGNPNLLQDATSSVPPTYKDLGIEKTQSQRWQKIASIPEPTFEARIVRVKDRRLELTTAGMLPVVTRSVWLRGRKRKNGRRCIGLEGQLRGYLVD